jgi:hypothetical protein
MLSSGDRPLTPPQVGRDYRLVTADRYQTPNIRAWRSCKRSGEGRESASRESQRVVDGLNSAYQAAYAEESRLRTD